MVDAGNGMGGYTVPGVFADLPQVKLTKMYFELDGSFPNHEANPIDPKNTADLQAKVREIGADIGLAFDGDADRCFVIDERGEIVSPSVLTALIASRELAREPGATIIHNLITSHAVPEIVREHGGVPVRTRVGHSFIKGEMARTGAVFGGEHSGHFYFRDFWRADSGMLAALHVAGGPGHPGGHAVGAAGAVLALFGQRRDQLRGRGPRGHLPQIERPTRPAMASASTIWTGSPSICRTAPGSTCGPPTPSRCCGSMSRPRTMRRCPRFATMSS